MHRRRMTAVYAAAHFFVDGCCALVVCRFARPDPRWLTAVLLYNFCASALQAPLGLLADRLGHGRVFAMTGCLLIAATPLLSGAPVALSVLAGVGNALFHIGGGRDVLCESEGRAGRLGVFVSPGAFGLFLGQLLRDSLPVLWLVPLLMILCALAVAAFCPALPGRGLSLRLNRAGRKPLLSLALLFAVVALRSCGGFCSALTGSRARGSGSSRAVWCWARPRAALPWTGSARGGQRQARWLWPPWDFWAARCPLRAASWCCSST